MTSDQRLRSVLDGESTNFSFEYRCDTQRAPYSKHGIIVDELLRNADAAMYQEKLAQLEVCKLFHASTASTMFFA